MHPRLHRRSIYARYHIGQRAEVQKEVAPREVLVDAQRSQSQEAHMPVGVYSCVERFGGRWRWLYIERMKGNLRVDERGCVPEAALELEERGDEQVCDPRVLCAVVAVGIEDDKGLVRF
jgi:hypothetical protein